MSSLTASQLQATVADAEELINTALRMLVMAVEPRNILLEIERDFGVALGDPRRRLTMLKIKLQVHE